MGFRRVYVSDADGFARQAEGVAIDYAVAPVAVIAQGEGSGLRPSLLARDQRRIGGLKRPR